jgi:hypothetical protein
MSEEIQGHKPVSIFKRLLNLFVGLYFFLAFFPFPFSLPFQNFAEEKYYQWEEGFNQALLPVAKWTAGTFFHAADSVILQPTGSGDTAYQYSMKFFWLLVALVVTTIWLLIDRKGKSFAKSNDLFRMSIRFLLVSVLFQYGFGKLHQFSPIGDLELDSTWGDTSPMGVIWKMMASNPNYTAFVGLLEAAPGFLLMFRRSSALGGILAAGVMAHIWMLNMFFDVPVKLHSLHYLVMALYIASPLFGRLFNVLLLNKPSEPILLIPPFQYKAVRYTSIFVGVAYWGYFSYVSVNGWRESISKLSEVKPPLVATWQVKSCMQNGAELIGSEEKYFWSKIVFFREGYATFYNNFQSTMNAEYEIDKTKKNLTFTTESDKIYTMKYELEGDNLTMSGDFTDGNTTIIARKTNPDRVIFSKPFRWISEKPDHR